ncbi:MAG: hypothetical protein ACFB0B_18545 [Thermonemataceae bacterium]
MGEEIHYTEKKLIHEQWAYKYFLKLRQKVAVQETSDAFHILTPHEIKAIRRIERTAYAIAAFYGVLGVILLYIPYWAYPTFFPSWTLQVPALGSSPVQVPWGFMLYGFILVFIELAALTLLNLWVVHKIAHICRFPSMNDPNYNTHMEALFIVGMEKESKRVLAFGINPLAGVSKLRMTLYTALFLFKATISNLFMKFILRKLTGRLAIRAYVDLIGIPVFAFWNAFATHLVVKRAKIRILASSLIQQLDDHLRRTLALGDNEVFKDIIYDTLQYIAQNKRDFHYNHYLMTNMLILGFGLPIKKDHTVDKVAFFEKIKYLKGKEKEGFFKMFLFGMLIDGQLSRKEKKIIDQLYGDGILQVNSQQAKIWVKQFLKGEGLGSFFQTSFTVATQVT